MRVATILRSRRFAVLAVALGLVGLVAPSAALGGGTGPVTNYLEYTLGTKGKANKALKAITIGFVNIEGGPFPCCPEATKGAQAAVNYVNAALGGVGGHPVKLKTCFIRQAEEEGQRCGQLMANDKNVSVIVFGGVFVGNQSFYGVLKGKKPVIIGVSASPVDGNQKNVFALLGDQPHVLGPWGTFARDTLKAKTAAILYQNEPGAIPAANATKKGLEDAGIKVTSVGFDPNLTDLLGPLTAAGGQTADVIVPMTAFVHCPKIATALQQIGSTKPVVANPLCIFGPGASYPGGDIPKNWVLGFAQANTAVQTPDVKAYLTTSARNGLKREDAIQVFAALGWSQILAVVRFMNGIGADNITPVEIASVARAFRGPVIMGPPTIRCGQFKEAIAICNDQTQFYQYQGQGKWKRVSGWLKPPK